MEAAKKNRTQQRRLFSKACNEFDTEEINLEHSEKIIKLKIIEEKAMIMKSVEEYVKELLFSESVADDISEKEIDESEQYIDRWRLLQYKLKQLTLSEREDALSNCSVSQQNNLLRYPKIQLPIFNGDLRNWIGFWGQFEKIDKDDNLDAHDKFSYLSQCMEKGSIAEELIKSFPPGGNSYNKALEQLKLRFGREELLIQVYVRDLLSLVLQKQNTLRKSLTNLYDLLETKLRALEILGVTRDKYASMLLPLVESALPEETLLAWERYRSTSRRTSEEENQNTTKTTLKTDLDSILDFLRDEVQAEERIALASQNFGVENKYNFKFSKEKKAISNKHKQGDAHQIASAAELLTSSKEQRQCIFCHKFHNSTDCMKARKMTIKDRVSIVEKSGCCFLCLKPNHQVRKCYSKINCLNCGKRHNILLCHNTKEQVLSPNEIEKENPDLNVLKSVQALSNVSKSHDVMLLTLTVLIQSDGKKRKARAIIDTASQRSYVLKNTAKELKLKRESFEYLQHSLFGGENTGVCKHDVFTVYLTSHDESYSCYFKVLSQPVICESLPPIMPSVYLKELIDYNICIYDDYQGPIEILIGADVAGKLLTGGCKTLSCGLTAIETRLGWTIMGRMPQVSSTGNEISIVNSMISTSRTITELWTLDTLGITDPSVKRNQIELQEAAQLHFLNTVHVKDNRFEVDLPWLEDHPPLPDYFDLAKRRLNMTVTRLKTESNYDAYENVFEEWIREGVIEEVTENVQGQVLYLPHREVIKENSTTRLRPVFDASAKVKGSPSLNDCLEKGPNLLEQIPSILTRFRKEQIGVISDIRRAFLQISVSPPDRDYLRFLWFSSDGHLKEYRHCRVVFGVSSSPFLLNSTIQLHLQTVLKKIDSGESSYPKEVIQKLMRSFYVDNCVSCMKNQNELKMFIDVSTKVMAERKFELRGWEFNDVNADATAETNVLGLIWNKKSDTLRINTGSINELCFEKITKRTILSAAHRLFDPLGICCPTILIPKLLLQETWKQKITWDEEVDPKTRTTFLKWLKDINYLEKIHIHRFFGSMNTIENTSVHIFCDASRHAYATAAFIRLETNDSVKVQLIQARSRVAPTGKEEITIARLELLAATIASRISSSILTEIQSEEVYFWTDSSTVLAWITREEAWNVFVQNRVQEIRSLTNKRFWRHVPGSMNPADLPSRGCSALSLLKSNWWLGPDWLYLPKRDWPKSDVNLDENEIIQEKKKSIVSSVTKCLVSTCSSVERDWYYRYFSNYKKIINLIAWILRFTLNCRSKQIERKHGHLDSFEIFGAEKLVIKMIQEESFLNEKDEKLKTLGVFRDESGILRLKTKLTFREDTEDFKMPAILPSKHEVVKRLVRYYHEKNAHAGTQILINILRERFWILNARKIVRSLINSCTVCKRFSTKNLETYTASPPEDRLREAAVFEICGVDFAGPMILRGNTKAWICLFTCAVYRAVHLELVESMSTESFLLALRRFIARRGRSKIIYCDNGTNFVGAANALQDLNWERISSETSIPPIQWKFNPPTASWWGGWWERLIGVLKKLLRRVLGRTSLTSEEIITVLCDCEAVINSRPLTYVTENDSTLIPLSPSLFLQDIQNSGVPDLDDIGHKSLNKRVKYRENLQKDLRNRFRSEYLGALIQKSENRKSVTLNIGDIVLIGNDNTKRISWPLGKIIQIFPGKDGITRLVRLKTSHGQLLRPIQRLYPLEISNTDPIIPKLSTEKVRKETTKDFFSDDILEVNSEPLIQKTRAGRAIKKPHKLDL